MPGVERTADGGFRVNEPVVAGFAALWLVSQIGTYVVGKMHWISQPAFDALSNQLVPVVAGVILSVIAALVRSKVTPAYKAVQDRVAKTGFELPNVEFTETEAAAILDAATIDPNPLP